MLSSLLLPRPSFGVRGFALSSNRSRGGCRRDGRATHLQLLICNRAFACFFVPAGSSKHRAVHRSRSPLQTFSVRVWPTPFEQTIRQVCSSHSSRQNDRPFDTSAETNAHYRF